MATTVRETRDRLKGLPQSSRTRECFYRVPERLDRVAVAVNGMPSRYETSRLREQQEQDAIDDVQRLVEYARRVGPLSRRCRCKRAHQAGECVVDACLQRQPDGCTMGLRDLDSALEQRLARAIECPHCIRPKQA